MHRLALTCLPLVLLLAAAAGSAGAAERRVPHGWLGTVVDGPLTASDGARHAGEWGLMAGAGVETARVAVYWDEHQPVRDAAELAVADAPRFRLANGVPTDFSRTDAVVAAAAGRGIAVLPVVHRTPAWAAATPGDGASPPADPADYARFVGALVMRYGPRGSFWAEHPELPRLPIRAWQAWNEPNLPRYWSRRPFARSYVALLRATRRAVRAADRGARVILAGLPNESWKALRSIYRAGGRGSFDAVALHPYTGRSADVVRLVRFARGVMRRHGDARLPIWVTELSWPAARGHVPDPVGFETSERGQARRLARALDLLARARRELRIERVLWYTWLSTEGSQNAFDWSGLRRLRGGGATSAPALAAFRDAARELQGCAKSALDARRCR